MNARIASALADLDSVMLGCEEADYLMLAHIIRRAVRTLRAELAPKLADQEDDGDPEVVGERIDPALFVKRAHVDPTFVVRPS